MSAAAADAPAAVRLAVLSSVLTVASLTFWFAVGFPWQLHNESLVWAIDLQRVSFWATLWSNPIAVVQTYRPLAIAMAWLTFRVTDGGIWLQQLINFALTAFAWIVASRSVSDRLSFAWISFIAGTAFFSGYIFLFHLHGVFYAPLLLFVAWLLVQDSRLPGLCWRTVGWMLAAAVLTALFHTFALLIFAAYLAGRSLQDTLARQRVNWAAVALALLVAASGMILLVSGSGPGGQDPIRGLLASYRAVELNTAVSAVSALLAVVAGISIAGPGRWRLVYFCAAVALTAALFACHVPLLLAWVVMCGLRALLSGRLAVAALTMACALLPVATGTGSPTYALFVLLPCTAITAIGLAPNSTVRVLERGLALITIASLPLFLLALKADADVPVLNRVVSPLRAEQEKTFQMMQLLSWLDANPNVRGNLSLCQPADVPVTSATAIERRYRAPTGAAHFAYYVKARYDTRFAASQPQLMMCFGSETRAGAKELMSIPGRWAGTASLQQLEAAAAG